MNVSLATARNMYEEMFVADNHLQDEKPLLVDILDRMFEEAERTLDSQLPVYVTDPGHWLPWYCVVVGFPFMPTEGNFSG